MFTIKIVVLSDEPDIIGKVCEYITDKDDKIISDVIDLSYKCFNISYCTPTIIVAFTNTKESKIIGFCNIDFTNGLHIESLCVDKDYRCRGVGKSIIYKVLQIGQTLNKKKVSWIELLEQYGNDIFSDDKKNNFVTLEIDKCAINYQKLLSFYTKCGFEIIVKPVFTYAYCRKIIK
jgi:ribosomal protein S18 acetylase RimI-like enzyme